MFLRAGIVASLLVLSFALPSGAAGTSMGVSTDCASLHLATHRSPLLKIDLWITGVEWGPGGLKVNGENVPGVPGTPPPGQWPSPGAPEGPDVDIVDEVVRNVTGSPPLDLQPVLDALVPLLRQKIGDVVESEFPVVQVEIRIPRLHPDHLPEGLRVTAIVDFSACAPD